jgi:hypothetical protein
MSDFQMRRHIFSILSLTRGQDYVLSYFPRALAGDGEKGPWGKSVYFLDYFHKK